MPLETSCCSLAGWLFFLFKHLANLYQSSFKGLSPQRPRVTDRRPGVRTGLVSTVLVLATTIELLASRRKAGKCRPHCKTHFTEYPVCWDRGVDIEIVPKWISSRLNEICRSFRRAEYRPELVYYMFIWCCVIRRCCLKRLMKMTSLAWFHGATFGWLMYFSFYACQVTVCLICFAQGTQLIETIVLPISVLQWMFVLLWCLHIDGVVYYSVSRCLSPCQWFH